MSVRWYYSDILFVKFFSCIFLLRWWLVLVYDGVINTCKSGWPQVGRWPNSTHPSILNLRFSLGQTYTLCLISIFTSIILVWLMALVIHFKSWHQGALNERIWIWKLTVRREFPVFKLSSFLLKLLHLNSLLYLEKDLLSCFL